MMTPYDDDFRAPQPDDDDATLFPPVLAAAAHTPHLHAQQGNTAPTSAITTWPAGDRERAKRIRADTLPSLPQSPSRLQRRWHLTPNEAISMPAHAHVTQPHAGTPAMLWLPSPATHPATHTAHAYTLSLAAQMMAQESPITEQGPPANDADSPWINDAPGMRMRHSE